MCQARHEAERRICDNGQSTVYKSARVFKFGVVQYEWAWNKSQFSNPQLAKQQPLKVHENICIFSNGKNPYNPQGLSSDVSAVILRRGKNKTTLLAAKRLNHIQRSETYKQEFTNYPKSIIEFSTGRNNIVHPTQKPVALYAYLIRTYTNPGDVVLDMCFGSNTTGVACIETGRNYIGIEKDRKYFEIGQRRIEQAQPPLFVETGTPANNVLQPTPKGAEQNYLFN